MSDDDKRIILKRRAQFIAAAFTGIVACEGGHEQPPVVCLSIAIPPPDAAPIEATDAGATIDDAGAGPRDAGAVPMACLSETLSPPDAFTDAGRPKPVPCLSPLPPPRDAGKPTPQPCLSVRKPPPDASIPHPCLSVLRVPGEDDKP